MIRFYRLVEEIFPQFWRAMGILGIHHEKVDPPFFLIINGSHAYEHDFYEAHAVVERAAEASDPHTFVGEFYSSEKAYQRGQGPLFAFDALESNWYFA
jgi:hypothetical protein